LFAFGVATAIFNQTGRAWARAWHTGTAVI
jgi:hypothetical protein